MRNSEAMLRKTTPSIRSIYMWCMMLVCFMYTAHAQDVENGQSLFKSNCMSCHALNAKVVGPPLAGVNEKYSEEWLIKWIKNAPAMVKSGDPDAVKIYEEYNGAAMTVFTFLSDDEIKDILGYIANPPVEASAAPGAVGSGAGAVSVEKEDNTLLIIINIAVMLFFVFVLLSLRKTVENALQERDLAGEGEFELSNYERFRAWLKRNPGVLILGIVILFIFTTKLTWDQMFDKIGNMQGYQPHQPIKFSHKLHAGINGVDCNYCHSGARHSKSAGIPSANVCMNCHAYISEGPNTGTEEIAKIYEAIGYDPDTRTYIEGYEQKPIVWNRIHNVPDLANFNHAQHVTAGQQECKTCHGPIEEMEEVYQYSPLTMGWCIECHRGTEINTENPYYHDLNKNWAKKYHGEKMTVDKIGGLECGKCHY